MKYSIGSLALTTRAGGGTVAGDAQEMPPQRHTGEQVRARPDRNRFQEQGGPAAARCRRRLHAVPYGRGGHQGGIGERVMMLLFGGSIPFKRRQAGQPFRLMSELNNTFLWNNRSAGKLVCTARCMAGFVRRTRAASLKNTCSVARYAVDDGAQGSRDGRVVPGGVEVLPRQAPQDWREVRTCCTPSMRSNPTTIAVVTPPSVPCRSDESEAIGEQRSAERTLGPCSMFVCQTTR